MSKDIKIGTWLFLTSLLFIFGSAGLGDSFLAMPTSISPADLAAHYRQNSQGILLFCAIQGVGALVWGLFIPAIAIAMMKMQRPSMYLVILHVMMGMIAVISPFTSIIFFGAAALRPDMDPATLQGLHDIGKAFFLTSLPTLIDGIVIAIAIFRDNPANPMFPRWFAWLNIVYAVGTQVNVFAPLVRTGPFGLDGVVGMYLPIFLVAVYIVATGTVLLRVPAQKWDAATR